MEDSVESSKRRGKVQKRTNKDLREEFKKIQEANNIESKLIRCKKSITFKEINLRNTNKLR